MGQFDSMGLPPVGRIGLSDSDRGIGLPERHKPMYVETKKKAKLKTAAAPASPPPPPPKNPPKGPKDKDKDNNKNPKKNGYLDKGRKK